ncbi:glutathione S-transferase N-terminal domain-containing protein [Shewanella schlegeliana]|uniref:Glutathione S-transferase N-terminal domain-containing protein n=1 Tax=Shewanella schlegeliana TaxID=190308 RepID=A0ABS1STE3_9GAMM|nr:glutathione S-transferase N-terminal domain-containing protein [Shewanella schlegeliana]MBL4911802.1 glutathione S-transferase N-terminal domain-containing protein [Shewanella schlegeliana]MCL1110244.1 glutathione S-transferase N-terminal domain-containing protein [Shewanella schlegeliana]GIU35837.1 glutaredoxin [Shewanella schlegeliana]
MFIIRWVLGRIILFLNFVFAPKKLKRPQEEQQRIDNATSNMTIYEYRACPFCVKVRRSLRRQGLNIITLDAKQEPHKSTLLNGGGKLQVPCMKIEENGQSTWMYESSEIINFLDKNFA